MHAFERRHDCGHQAVAGPGAEHPLGDVHTCRAVAIVWQPGAGAERIDQLIHDCRLGRRAERAGGELQTVLLARQDHRADLCQLELLPVVRLQEVGGCVASEPFAQPTRVQSRPAGQILCRDRPRAVEDSVEPEAITEVDQQRDHLALLEAPHAKCEPRHLVGIDPAGRRPRRPRHRTSLLERAALIRLTRACGRTASHDREPTAGSGRSARPQLQSSDGVPAGRRSPARSTTGRPGSRRAGRPPRPHRCRADEAPSISGNHVNAEL